MTDNQKIDELKRYIQTAEENLEAAKKALFDITGEELAADTGVSHQLPPNLKASSDGKVIEGIFNGENMVGPEGKVFPVPANYASKSKLVEGDRLKLTVAEDGAFIFKQIGPVERKNLVGELVFEDNAYHVTAEGKRYNLLYAAVTYHKAKPGEKVTIVVPADGSSNWAAFENIIHDVASTVAPEENLFEPAPNPEQVPADGAAPQSVPVTIPDTLMPTSPIVNAEPAPVMPAPKPQIDSSEPPADLEI